MTCRICSGAVRPILDLGMMPPANSLKNTRDEKESRYPLVLEMCDGCGNLQLQYCVSEKELYSQYFYITPDSPSLRNHYEFLIRYMFDANYLRQESSVVEIGSNIGRFLTYLKGNHGIQRVLGVDPAQNVCALACEEGVETVCSFFNRAVAAVIRRDHGPAELIVARHCCAHNKNPHQILRGVYHLLADDGFFVMENAYALNTLQNNEFDQIYHEHMFYYMIRSVRQLFEMNNLILVDIVMTPIHGGSVIFFAQKKNETRAVKSSVEKYAKIESDIVGNGMIERFVNNTILIKKKIKYIVENVNKNGKNVWAYGATAKGSTLLNFLQIDYSEIPYCVDSTSIKQGKFLPMSNIEIIPEEFACSAPPDYFLLTAWNYKAEIIKKVRSNGNLKSQFIVPIPSVQIEDGDVSVE